MRGAQKLKTGDPEAQWAGSNIDEVLGKDQETFMRAGRVNACDARLLHTSNKSWMAFAA